MRRLVLPAVLGAALLIPATAQANLPWVYAGGSFDYYSGTVFTLNVLNTTSSTQTVEFFASQHAIAPNGLLQLVASLCGSSSCTAILDFSATSPDLAPYSTAVETVGGYVGPVYIGPGQFRVYGPSGSVENEVAGLAGADAGAFGSLQSATSTIQGLVAGVPSSLASSPISGQLQSLSAKVDQLSAHVAAVTKALNPKAASKGKKKRVKRKKHA